MGTSSGCAQQELLPCQGTVASMGLWCTSQNRRRQGLSPVTSFTCQHLNCENGCQAWELQWVQLPPFSSNMLLHMGHWPTREGMLQQVITAQVMFHIGVLPFLEPRHVENAGLSSRRSEQPKPIRKISGSADTHSCAPEPTLLHQERFEMRPWKALLQPASRAGIPQSLLEGSQIAASPWWQ